MMAARIAALAACLALAGCLHTGPGSIAGGECKVFERPAYAIAGRTAYDQNWIDGTIEGGVAACGWKRPGPRPEAIEKGRAPRLGAKPKRRGFVQRVKDRVMREAPPAAPTPPPQADPPVLPRRPRADIDELLNPSEPLK